jgi:hypothetical protein
MKRKYKCASNRRCSQTGNRPGLLADRASGTGTDDCPSAATRELAQRPSGTVEVRLLWRPGIEQVELAVRDRATGKGFRIEVAPGNAIDAFYHPYAYAAECDRA